MPRFYRIHTGLFRKYLFSLDHKVIGLQYALTSLIFLLIGFALAIVFRWQLAYPMSSPSGLSEVTSSSLVRPKTPSRPGYGTFQVAFQTSMFNSCIRCQDSRSSKRFAPATHAGSHVRYQAES